ncbi:MAG: flagellar basal body rod C-terminal domain-containing protein, partial [Candidatus Tumulicola sp.]
VLNAAGNRIQTRAGAFTRERDGTLRDAAGRTLVGDGRTLRVPEDATIDERGCVVTRDGAILGRIPLPEGSALRSGFLEGASVDAIHEMLDVLCAERAFESAEKVVSAIDRTREKSAGDVARVK